MRLFIVRSVQSSVGSNLLTVTEYWLLPTLILFKLTAKEQTNNGASIFYLSRLSLERRCSSRTFRYGYLVTT